MFHENIKPKPKHMLPAIIETLEMTWLTKAGIITGT